jgi:altronate hydrolase
VVVRDLDPNLSTPPPTYIPEAERRTFRGFRRADGRLGTRNFLLVVRTSMCASHEASQIAMIAEFTEYSRERFPNVDGVVAIPHNKGCGCSDGSTIEIMLRTLGNYASHPSVAGVAFIGLGCEKTNLTVMERFLAEHKHTLKKPSVRIGIQDVGGTEAAVRRGVEAVVAMRPADRPRESRAARRPLRAAGVGEQ